MPAKQLTLWPEPEQLELFADDEFDEDELKEDSTVIFAPVL
jgi:hypothetical protein